MNTRTASLSANIFCTVCLQSLRWLSFLKRKRLSENSDGRRMRYMVALRVSRAPVDASELIPHAPGRSRYTDRGSSTLRPALDVIYAAKLVGGVQLDPLSSLPQFLDHQRVSRKREEKKRRNIFPRSWRGRWIRITSDGPSNRKATDAYIVHLDILSIYI